MKKNQMNWTEVDRDALAEHLKSANISHSQAIGQTSMYHCRKDNEETIAIALPDGNGLIIGLCQTSAPRYERRKKQRSDRRPDTK